MECPHDSLVTLHAKTKINTSDEWDILWYTTRKPCITILYHVVENTEPYIINPVHDGKVGCYTVELH